MNEIQTTGLVKFLLKVRFWLTGHNFIPILHLFIVYIHLSLHLFSSLIIFIYFFAVQYSQCEIDLDCDANRQHFREHCCKFHTICPSVNSIRNFISYMQKNKITVT